MESMDGISEMHDSEMDSLPSGSPIKQAQVKIDPNPKRINDISQSFIGGNTSKYNWDHTRSFVGEGGLGGLDFAEYEPPPKSMGKRGDPGAPDYHTNIDKWGYGWKEAVAARKANPRQLVYNSRYVDPEFLDQLDKDKWIVRNDLDFDYDGEPDIAVFNKKNGRVKAFNGLTFRKSRDVYDKAYMQAVPTREARKQKSASDYYFYDVFKGRRDKLGEVTPESLSTVKGNYELYKTANKGRKLPSIANQSAYSFYVEHLMSQVTKPFYDTVKEVNKIKKANNEELMKPLGVVAKIQSDFYHAFIIRPLIGEANFQLLTDPNIPDTRAKCQDDAMRDRFDARAQLKRRITNKANRTLIKHIIYLLVTKYNNSKLMLAIRSTLLGAFVDNFAPDAAAYEEGYNAIASMAPDGTFSREPKYNLFGNEQYKYHEQLMNIYKDTIQGVQ